jgi:antitoxin VapB
MTSTNSVQKADPASSGESQTPIKKAKLFKNGRSQAVRLPKEFRFEGTEVEIRREPATGEVVLSSAEKRPARSMQEWFDRFDALDIPDGVFDREVHMPEERDIF